uniref:leukemia inhibitory factor receptor-like n=1 Tax=Myxine glutinosa TaxID=7769 RepID=UPI00358F78BD
MCTVRSLGQEANFFEAAREMNWNLLNLIVIATVSFHVAGVDSCRITPDNIIAEVGGNLMATCDYRGDAIAGDVRWLHNNTSLSSEVIVHQNSTSSTIKLTTLKASRLNGDNLICLPSLNHLCGTLVFVGNRPETPKSLSCKTGDLVNLHCTWDRGNDTNLQFKNESTYRLHYNVSNGESGSVKAAQSNALLRSLKRNQNYTLWVEVFNALGRRASAPLKLTPLSAFQPSPPQDVTVSPGVVLINVTWTVEHADLELQCEVYAQEANTWQDKTVVRLQAFPQKPQLSMGTTVEGLVPYTPYDVSVRCHHNTDGRWSSWSNVKSTQTKEGAPSKAPTLWRNFIRTEKTNNTSIMLVWKPLKQAEAHGLVHSYHLHLSTGTAGSVPDKKIVNANETTFYLERGGVRAELMAQTIGGLSPPSSLYIPVMDPAGSIKHRRQVVGDGKCIHLNWGPRLAAISYIVEWKLVEQPAIGKLGWKEIEGNTSTAKICSANGDDIIPFRRYQVAVHAKQNDGNMLIDQAEAYLEEDVPERGPHVQHQESLGSVSLLIKGLPISACRGFLTSYTLYVTLEEHKTRTQEHKTKRVHVLEPSVRSHVVDDLSPGLIYSFHITANTSVGESPPGNRYRAQMPRTGTNSFLYLVLLTSMLLCFVLLASLVLLHRYQPRLQKFFITYPDIYKVLWLEELGKEKVAVKMHSTVQDSVPANIMVLNEVKGLEESRQNDGVMCYGPMTEFGTKGHVDAMEQTVTYTSFVA